MNAGETELGPVDEDMAEDALVLRPAIRCGGPQAAAGRRGVPAAPCPRALHLPRPSSALHPLTPRFDLTANLAGLIGSGAMTAIRHPVESEGPQS